MRDITSTPAATAAALLLALVLAACLDGDRSAAPPTTAPPTAPASPSPESSASASPAATAAPGSEGDGSGDVVLDASCEMPTPNDVASVTLHHPAGWDVGGDVARCSYFSPDDVDLEPNTEPEGVDVRWSVEPAPFERVAASDRATRDEQHVTAVVDGHRATRTSAVSTGRALLPEGVRTTTWAVDLSRSSQGPATLIGTTHDTGGVDERAIDVLDAMARRVQIGGDAGEDRDVTVARRTGRHGFAVAYRAADGCLELYTGRRQGSRVDSACDLALDGGAVETAILRGDGLEVLAGVASPRVDVVRLRANTDAQRAALAVDVQGALRAFALPISGTEATAVAVTFDGEQLDSVEVLPE